MEYIITIAIMAISIILLKIGLNIHIKDIKKIKEIGYDKELNKIASKFPANKEICTKILEKLDNKKVKIEEEKDSKTSLYIAISDKIIIANIKDTFTRIQTIAHECLHSVQNRTMLLFNFIFSNISLLYFLVAIFLVLFNVLDGFVFIQIYIGIGIISYVIKSYLETDAMTKAFYIAKEYMEETAKASANITKEEVDILLDNIAKLNKIGISLTNFYLIVGIMLKIIFLCIMGLIF